MYWENVSAKPVSGLASTQSRVPRPERQVAGDDVGEFVPRGITA